MVKNDARLGKILREARRFIELQPRRLQIEAEAAPGELRKARSPALVAHLSGTWFVPDAAHEIELGQRLDRPGGIVAVQPGLRHGDGGKPSLAPQPLHVAHLAQRIAWIPLGLHVDGLFHVVGCSVGEIIGRQVGPPQRRIVPVAERDGRLVAQPRVIVDARIPEMLVRIDDREHGSHGAPS